MHNLKRVLKDSGRTQKWFAKQIGKTENTISLWVNNKVEMSLSDLYKAAEILDCEVADLLIKKEDRKS